MVIRDLMQKLAKCNPNYPVEVVMVSYPNNPSLTKASVGKIIQAQLKEEGQKFVITAADQDNG